MWLHPEAPPLRVLAVERERAIVLEKCWTFFLQPIDEHSTRLIVRGRGNFNPDFKNALLNFLFWRVVFEPAHFIMERKMLLGIKERVEQNGAVAQGTQWTDSLYPDSQDDAGGVCEAGCGRTHQECG